MKTAELTGAMLDYWVARAEGWTLGPPHRLHGWDVWRDADGVVVGTIPASAWKPSTDWTHGGPIIERERIRLQPTIPTGAIWYASIWMGSTLADGVSHRSQADAPLVAAMRAYVASKFGDEVPDDAAIQAAAQGEKDA
jgi:hypothetical protein